MRTSIFTIYDNAAKAHLMPFFAHNSAMAERTFMDAINEPGHRFNKHPDHYTLFIHGSFEDEDAEFTLQAAPKSIGNGVQYKNSHLRTEEEIDNAEKVSDVPSIRYNA